MIKTFVLKKALCTDCLSPHMVVPDSVPFVVEELLDEQDGKVIVSNRPKKDFIEVIFTKSRGDLYRTNDMRVGVLCGTGLRGHGIVPKDGGRLWYKVVPAV